MQPPRFKSFPGTDVYNALIELRGSYLRTGMYPVCLGDPDAYANTQLPSAEEIASTIEKSRKIVLPDWFVEQRESEPGRYRSPEGNWPAKLEEADIPFRIDEQFANNPKQHVLIGLFNVSAPWEIFAHIDWGGWNECPGPQENCAVLRYWEELYGAEVLSVTDSIDCIVSRPPATMDDSIKLAREQYAFSPDIVDQGCSEVMMLAATIQSSDYWYFWWD